jgi:HSP20 family protein
MWGDRGRDVDQFRGFKNQIDSLFEDWFGRSMGGLLAPRIDVAEDEHAVVLWVELPGVAEGDIDVSLNGDQLTIKGEKRSEHQDKNDMQGYQLHRTERAYGAFQRTVAIPYKVDPEQITATFRDGVLKISVPKPAATLAPKQGRKIEVNKAAAADPASAAAGARAAISPVESR